MDLSYIPDSCCCSYFSVFLFFFLPYFQTLKIFVTLFSGTVRPRKLKLGTHVDSWQIYCVYQNQAATAYSSLYFFHFSFSPIFKHWNFSSHFSQELWGLEGWNLVHTWTLSRCIVYTGIRLLLLICPFYFFIFLSLNFSSYFSQELWDLDVWNLVHTWTVGRCIVYTTAYSSLYIFIFLSLNFHFFPFLKFLVHNISFSSDSAIAGL